MLQPYPKYKAINLPWLKEIPEYWDIKKIRNYFTERKCKVSDKDYPALSVSKHGVVPQLETACKTDYGDNRKLVKEGDFVINSRSDRKGSSGISPADGSVSLINIVLEPRFINRIFINYLFKSNLFIEEFYRNGRGIVADLWTTRYQEMRNISFPIPPKDEQEKIVAYLDERIAKIDKYISAETEKIKLLRELKNAEISQAVTRGLNPNVKYKAIDLPWLKEIPEHWKTRKAKYLFNKEKRAVRANDEVITCFRDGQVTLRKNRRLRGFTESISEIGYQGIRKGDLVIHQMDAFAGAIGVSDSDGKGTSVYHCCTGKEPICPMYYAYLLRQMAKSGFIQSLYRGIRERSSDFNFPIFGKQFILVPPLSEQEKIVAYLDEKIAKIDKAISAIQQKIDLMKEYKSSLISSVVTGKVMVS